jgi:hypothetical protein
MRSPRAPLARRDQRRRRGHALLHRARTRSALARPPTRVNVLRAGTAATPHARPTPRGPRPSRGPNARPDRAAHPQAGRTRGAGARRPPTRWCERTFRPASGWRRARAAAVELRDGLNASPVQTSAGMPGAFFWACPAARRATVTKGSTRSGTCVIALSFRAFKSMGRALYRSLSGRTHAIIRTLQAFERGS